MRILLDTHAFLWWDHDPSQLSTQGVSLLQDPSHEVLLSVASVWEIQIKSQLGKIQLELPLLQIVEDQCRLNAIQILPVQLRHVWVLERLENHHKDPFDRLLVAQAIQEECMILSKDPQIAKYPVNILW